MCDTVKGKVARAIETGSLITLVGPSPRVRRLAIIIDACESGAGLLNAVTRSASAATWQTPWRRREGIWVIAATRPKEDAGQGTFVSALVDAVRETAASTGSGQEFLAIETILDRINEQFEKLGGGQQATGVQVPYGTGLLPIFRNPNHRPAREVGSTLDRLFVGRVRALDDLRAWLRGNDSRPRVVTGDPGSGKSALLGQVAAKARGESGRPPWSEQVVSVSALKSTAADGLVADLATAAGLNPMPIKDLVSALPSGALIVVDGLDEAVEPNDVMTRVLAPLADRGGEVRLLISTRRPHHARLPFPTELIDLDSTQQYKRDDVRLLVTRVLTSTDTPSRGNYGADRAAAQTVAEVIANRADRSFLLARSAAVAVNTQDRTLTPGEVDELMSGWEGVGAAFDDDLEQRFGDDTSGCATCWRPWPGLGVKGCPGRTSGPQRRPRSPTGGRTMSNDVRWLLDAAYAYVTEILDEGRSVYRIFHAELPPPHLR